MSEKESRESAVVENIISPEQIPALIRTNQQIVNIWVNEAVDKSAAYASTRKVLLDKLSKGIRHETDFDGVGVMMDFFAEGKKDDDKFKGLAKEIKLVDICQPSYRFMYQNWQPQEKKRAKWNFVENRLLRKDNLAKAASLHLGGILFGIDEKGNPMVADGGLGPVYLENTYAATYKAMMENGYEFFDFNYLPGDEIVPAEYTRKFEIFTGAQFIEHEDHNYTLSIWADSGPCSGRNKDGSHWSMENAGVFHFRPNYQRPGYYIRGDRGQVYFSHPEFGVRRLFRAKK